MEEIFGQCIIWVLVSIGISVLVKIYNTVNKKRLLAKMPSEEELAHYITSLNKMKEQGASFHDQKDFLIRAGVDQKIAEVLIANVEKEEE